MILAPSTRRSFAKVSAANSGEKFLTEGVDGQEKRCRMGGSPRTKRLGAQTGKRDASERSLTVCAGELCGRLVLNGSRPVQSNASVPPSKKSVMSFDWLGTTLQKDRSSSDDRKLK